MSSTTTTWSTDTNTKSGSATTFTNTVSSLKLLASEGEDAILQLFADEGDDNADHWRIVSKASDNKLNLMSFASGAWSNVLSLYGSGTAASVYAALPAASKLYLDGAGGTTYLQESSDGHLEINSGTTIDITAPTVDLNSSTEFNIDTVLYDLNASGAVTMNGTTIDVDGTGAMQINSSGGTIGIGNDAVAQAINIGTGAAARVITMGNVTGATQVVLNSGTAGIALASTGAGDITIDSDDTLLLDADGVLELNSSAGAINIGNDDIDQAINIGTQGERTISIGTGSFADEVVIGNTTGASGVHLKAGTGDVQVTGNLGIGVADPDVPLEILDTSTQLKLSYDATNYATFAIAADGMLTLTTVDPDGAEADIILAPDGNVGIGTTDPAGELDIYQSDDGTAAGPNLYLTRHSASPADDDILGKITFRGRDDGGGYETYSFIQSTILDASNGTEDGYLEFGSQVAGTGATRMVVGYNGDVGIGTTAPAARLHAYDVDFPVATLQRHKASSSDAAYGILKILASSGDDIGDGFGGEVQFRIGDDGASDQKIAIINAVRDGADNSGKLQLHTFSGGSQSTGITIDDAGQVGIGTTTPTRQLEVSDSDGGQINLHREDTAIIDGEGLGAVYFSGRDSTGAGTSNLGAKIVAYCDTTAWDTTTDVHTAATKLQFFTQDETTTDTTSTARMTIDKDGNIGIGTTSPGYDLHIKGGAADDATTGGGQLALQGTDTTIVGDVDLGTIYFTGSDSSLSSVPGVGAKILAESSGTWNNSDEHFCPSSLGFYTQDGTTSDTFSAPRMYIESNGNVGIGDSAPDANLCINQAAADTAIFTLKSSDVAHGLTDVAQTDTYFSLAKASGATGGITMNAIGNGSARTNFRMYCYTQGTPDETNSTSGFGEFALRAYKHDGSNSSTTHGADANIFTVHNGGDAKFIVKGDGDIYYDGADQGAYDSYNDAHLIRTMDTTTSPKEIIQSKFDDYIKYNEETLVDAGLLGDVDKSNEETPLVNLTGMQKLHNGAIWQQYTEMQKMKELMYETMVELMGKEKADKKLDSHDIKLLDKGLLN